MVSNTYKLKSSLLLVLDMYFSYYKRSLPLFFEHMCFVLQKQLPLDETYIDVVRGLI